METEVKVNETKRRARLLLSTASVALGVALGAVGVVSVLEFAGVGVRLDAAYAIAMAASALALVCAVAAVVVRWRYDELGISRLLREAWDWVAFSPRPFGETGPAQVAAQLFPRPHVDLIALIRAACRRRPATAVRRACPNFPVLERRDYRQLQGHTVEVRLVLGGGHPGHRLRVIALIDHERARPVVQVKQLYVFATVGPLWTDCRPHPEPGFPEGGT
jgi:hypothetical protein